ncbi:MAG: histone deacetylase family protein [Thermodesulfobacteriota bacterium]
MLRVANTLGVVFFPAFDWAISPTHPERQERLLYTMDQLQEEGVFDIPGIAEYKPDIASLEDVERVHFCFPRTESVITDSHLISAGGAIRAGQMVLGQERQKAFALVRPPGHHAMKCVHGGRGFCNINMEAVMIERLRREYGVRRVAVVDTDCHHGDGTQDVYWHDPDTLFISLHQDGRTIFPGSGFPGEIGGPKAGGLNLNVPLPPGTGDDGFLLLMDELILPVLEDFQPELIIHSAGQDNHFSDPITSMNLSAQGYAELSRRLQADIAVLEGGYAIEGALPYVNTGIILAMAGLDFSHVREPDFRPESVAQDKQITEYLKHLAPAVRELYFEPPEKLLDREKEGEFFVRDKEIFYDTDGIMEQQREFVLDCPDCPGLYKVETSSTKTPFCLGIESGRQCCDRCVKRGEEEFVRAQKSLRFAVIQYINRGEDVVQRVVGDAMDKEM